MKLSKLNKEEKTILYAMGMLDDMVETGMLDGPILLTKKGKKQFLKLLKKGWNPDPVELMTTCAELIEGMENGTLFDGVDDG